MFSFSWEGIGKCKKPFYTTVKITFRRYNFFENFILCKFHQHFLISFFMNKSVICNFSVLRVCVCIFLEKLKFVKNLPAKCWRNWLQVVVLSNSCKRSCRSWVDLNWLLIEWELGVVVSELGSRLKGCGFESRLFQIPHGNGVEAMPGSIPVKTPNPGSQKIEKI